MAEREEHHVDLQLADGTETELDHGHVVIAAITSCTNTSNPSVMIAAGLLAKHAVERGLQRLPALGHPNRKVALATVVNRQGAVISDARHRPHHRRQVPRNMDRRGLRGRAGERAD